MNVLYALTLVAATFLWGYFFYKKDYHPQPIRIILQVFGIGLFAMLPIFAYRSIYQNLLPQLAEYALLQPLFSKPLLIGVSYFAINILILGALLFGLSAVLTLVLTFFQHQTLINIKKAIAEESMDFIAVSVMIGILIYAESGIQNILNIEIIQAALGTILFLGVIEEYIKHLIVRFTDDKKLKDIDDAITLSIMVGLAFALIETVIYAVSSGNLELIIYRSFLSLPIHLIASGIFGYYYGLAHFAEPILKAEHKNKRNWLAKTLKLKQSTIYEEAKMTEGLFFATLFHVVANVLFEINMAFLVVPLVVLGMILIGHLYKSSQVEWLLIKRFKRSKA